MSSLATISSTVVAGTAGRLLHELQRERSAQSVPTRNDASFAAAENIALNATSNRRGVLEREVRARNDALLAARATSIRASFDAKVRRTEELLHKASEARILRMRQAQIENLRAREQAKLEELEHDRDVTVSYELIAAGRVRIVPERASPKPVPEPPAAAQPVFHMPPSADSPGTEPVIQLPASTAASERVSHLPPAAELRAPELAVEPTAGPLEAEPVTLAAGSRAGTTLPHTVRGSTEEMPTTEGRDAMGAEAAAVLAADQVTQEQLAAAPPVGAPGSPPVVPTPAVERARIREGLIQRWVRRWFGRS